MPIDWLRPVAAECERPDLTDWVRGPEGDAPIPFPLLRPVEVEGAGRGYVGKRETWVAWAAAGGPWIRGVRRSRAG